jgi:hypothetical protein
MTGRLWMWVLGLCIIVAGCGGSSAPATAPPVARAATSGSVVAGAVVALDGSGSSGEGALNYSWALTSRPGGSVAVLNAASTARATFVADVAGIYVARLTVSADGLSSFADVTVTATPLPRIVADQSEPYAGVVTFSVANAPGAAGFQWYVGPNGRGTGASYAWNTELEPDGLVRVYVAYYDAALNWVQLEFDHPITVPGPGISIVPTASPVGPVALLSILARSASGIASVTGSLDGAAPVVLTSPNRCFRLYCEANVYDFPVDVTAVGSGNHAMLVTVANKAGATRQMTVRLPLYQSASLTLAAPAASSFVFGTLPLAWDFTADRLAPIVVKARLNNVDILTSPERSFSRDIDISGVSPGGYDLVVTAYDQAEQVAQQYRYVVVGSSSAQVYRPLLDLGLSGRLLAVDGDLVLYQADDQTVRLRDTRLDTETRLTGVPLATNVWKLSAGRAYAETSTPVCGAAFSRCVLEWLADGSARNLTLATGGVNASAQRLLSAHDGHVLLLTQSDGQQALALYKGASGALTKIALAAGVQWGGSADFALADSVVHVVYTGTQGGGVNLPASVYRWRADTQASTLVESPPSSFTAGSVATDGVRVAWLWTPRDISSFDGTLQTQALLGGPTIQLSQSAEAFKLAGGTLVWYGNAINRDFFDRAAFVSLGVDSPISARLPARDRTSILSVTGNFVVYADPTRTYSWNARLGQSTMLAAVPLSATVDNTVNGSGANNFFFEFYSNGPSKVLYKLDLGR